MASILDLKASIVERIVRQFSPPHYEYCSGLNCPDTFDFKVKESGLLTFTPVSQDPGSDSFVPLGHPERYDNPSDAVLIPFYDYSFEYGGTRTWEVVKGVDWKQIHSMRIPALIPGAPEVSLTLKETAPLQELDRKLPYSGRAVVEVPAQHSVVTTAGFIVRRPSAFWRGMLKLVGGVTYTILRHRPDGGSEFLTPVSPVGLDHFFNDYPHPLVTVLGPNAIGIAIEVAYAAEVPQYQTVRTVPAKDVEFRVTEA